MAGHSQPRGLAIEGLDHPGGELDVDPSLLVTGTPGFDRSRYRVMYSPTSKLLSSSFALVFIEFDLF